MKTKIVKNSYLHATVSLDAYFFIQNFYLIWEKGTLYNGSLSDASWQNGIWLTGKADTVQWGNGVWYDGIWEGGSWDNGTWLNGNWIDGRINRLWGYDRISPKSYYKPYKTLSLNYAKYT